MKYLFRDLKNNALKDWIVIGIIAVTVMATCFMIHIAYAVYWNYTDAKENTGELQQYVYIECTYEYERIDAEDSGIDNGSYLFGECSAERQATIGMLRQFGSLLSASIYDDLAEVSTRLNLENYPMGAWFSFDETGFIISSLEKEAYENGTLSVDGRYYTDEEYADGERVALAFDYQHVNVGRTPWTDSMLLDEEHMLLAGMEYEVIGYQSDLSTDLPVVPIGSLPDDTPLVYGLRMDFNHSVTRSEYNVICDAVQTAFGDLMEVEAIEFPDYDTLRMYNTVIAVACIICMIALINCAIMYSYLLKKQLKKIRCMRICGLSRGKAVRLYLAECLFVTVPVYLISAMIFAKYLLPCLSGKYEYGFSKFNQGVYIIFLGIFVFVSVVILSVMLLRSIRRRLLG